MRAEDEVVVLEDPGYYGVGRVCHTTKDGHVVVRFCEGEREVFTPHELELYTAWKQRRVAA
jgi:hypothetical protein